jgi:hypothetical protein
MASPSPGIPTLRYPFKAIKDFDDYLEIQILKYQPPKFDPVSDQSATILTSTDKLSGNNVTPECVILLPIPQTIQDSNSVNWGDSSLNAFEVAGIGAVQTGVQNKNLLGGSIDALRRIFGTTIMTAQGGNLQDLVTGATSAAIVNLFGSNVSATDILSRSTGQALNPNMELLFQGVNLREFSFDFDFAPRDGAEANQVKQIIRTLKKAQTAKTSAGKGQGNGLFISAPNVFKLQYKSGGEKHPFLHTFKPMAMKGMSVNYTGSGTYSVYGDSTPIHMKLTMNFQELNPIYSEDYKDSDIGVGY